MNIINRIIKAELSVERVARFASPYCINLGEDIQLVSQILTAIDRQAGLPRLPLPLMVSIWQAWRRANAVEVGFPASLSFHQYANIDGEQQTELRLHLLPFYELIPGVWLDIRVCSGCALEVYGIFTTGGKWKVDSHEFQKRFRIPNEADTVWEGALAHAFELLRCGVAASEIDQVFFCSDAAWRKFYLCHDGRVVRRDNGRPAAVQDSADFLAESTSAGVAEK